MFYMTTTATGTTEGCGRPSDVHLIWSRRCSGSYSEQRSLMGLICLVDYSTSA